MMIVCLLLLDSPSPAAETESISEILYSKALESYALGDAEAALAALGELESTPSPGSAGGELESVRRVELAFVRDTLRAPADVLLPVIVLHERAYRSYLERGLLPQAYHARTMALLLIELYVDEADEPSARQVAGGLLASLAGYFQETSKGPAVFALYYRSLELDRRSEAALLGLAVAHEQRGQYERALPHLERLVAAHPESAEGRLRLAVNLDRFERREDAVTHLRRLIRGEPPGWILSLAYQELARMLCRQEESEAARRLLMEGSRRLPRDSALAIGLAYLNEREGLAEPDSDLAETLGRSAGAEGPPPRFRYSLQPDEPFERLRERLRTEADRRRGDLARILSSRRSSEAD